MEEITSLIQILTIVVLLLMVFSFLKAYYQISSLKRRRNEAVREYCNKIGALRARHLKEFLDRIDPELGRIPKEKLKELKS